MSVEDEFDRITDLMRAVVTRQHEDRDPAHEDFYVWGWALSELTARLQDGARVLGRQVAGYGDRRILRDDEEGADPAARLVEAGAHLAALVSALDQANRAARLYHSAVGHIAVEVDPETTP